jgi:hypothetical protein
MISSELIQKFQPGGVHYEALKTQYGQRAADHVAAAARTGQQDVLNAALSDARRGTIGRAIGPTTIAGALWEQAGNIFEAPIEALNRQVGGAVSALFKNPWVLGLLAVGIFLALGGPRWFDRK